jgi:hypothetical protein
MAGAGRLDVSMTMPQVYEDVSFDKHSLDQVREGYPDYSVL